MGSWKDLPDVEPAKAPKGSWKDLPDAEPAVAQAPAQQPDEPGFVEKAQAVVDKLNRYNPGMAVPNAIKDRAQYVGANAPKAGPGEVPYWAVTPDEASRVRAVLSGATLGFAPRIMAAHDTGEFSGPSYEEAKGHEKALYGKAVADHPVENLAGGFMTPVPGGAAKGVAGVVARPLVAAGLGGAAGYANAEPGHEAEDTAKGAGLGFFLGGSGEVLASKAPALKALAGKKAVTALVGSPEISNVVRNRAGLKTAQDIENFGNQALEEGLVKFGQTPAKTEEQVAAMVNKHGTAIGDADKAALAAGGKLDKSAVAQAAEDTLKGINPTRAAQADKAHQAIAEIREGTKEAALKKLIEANPDIAKMGKGAQEQLVAQELAAHPPAVSDYAQLREQLADIRKSVNEREGAPLSHELLGDAREAASGALNDQVASKLPPKQAESFQEALKKYAFAKKAQSLNERAVTREAGHKSPVGSFVFGTAIGGPAAGAAMGAHALAKNRQEASIAALLKLASQAAPNSSKVADRLAPLIEQDRKERDDEELLNWFKGGH